MSKKTLAESQRGCVKFLKQQQLRCTSKDLDWFFFPSTGTRHFSLSFHLPLARTVREKVVVVSEHRVDRVRRDMRPGLDDHEVPVVVLHVERPRDAHVAVELVDHVAVETVHVEERHQHVLWRLQGVQLQEKIILPLWGNLM